MEPTKITEILKAKHPGTANEPKIAKFIHYLKVLAKETDYQGAKKNPWVEKATDESLAYAFSAVHQTGVDIDGEQVTLQNLKGQLTPSFNYQAYKNLVLKRYPETTFDIQIVRESDTYEFRKENGQVKYSHEIRDPFNKDNKTVGAYCIIKNQRGEFLETLNMAEIQKMKNVAKTKAIWEAWEDEMIKKSMMKRSCKTHFKDITEQIDTLDNDNYDLETVNIDSAAQISLEACNTPEEIDALYKQQAGTPGFDEFEFLKAATNRIKQFPK